MRILEGFIECPVAVSVDAEALHQHYLTRVAGHRVVITLPPVDTNAADVERPPLTEPQWHFRGISLPANEVTTANAGGPMWGEVTHVNGARPMAAAVKRLRVVVEADTDDAGERKIAQDIARHAPRWWRSVTAWIEVLHGQDLSRLGPAAPGWHLNGTTFWTQLEGDHGKNATFLAPQPGRHVMSPYSALTANQLKHCMQLAEGSEMPSAAWLYLRDARSMYLGYDRRRAAIDAGTAAEIALTQMITTHLSGQGLSDEAIERKIGHLPLGRLCNYWEKKCGGALPARYKDLLKVRNYATHAKTSVTREQVKDAIDIAAAIVAAADPLDRHSAAESTEGR